MEPRHTLLHHHSFTFFVAAPRRLMSCTFIPLWDLISGFNYQNTRAHGKKVSIKGENMVVFGSLKFFFFSLCLHRRCFWDIHLQSHYHMYL
jgi:hypothetical protein